MPIDSAINSELLKRALQVSGERNEEDVVNKALREFVARREQKDIVELFGKLEWDGDHEYNRERIRSEPSG